MATPYAATADELTNRIVTMIPDHPEIMDMDSPWDLFKVEGFQCRDLQPSMFQASWALRKAQDVHRDNDSERPE